jgi:hypothetical protein
VRLCPYKGCIYEFDLSHASDTFDAESEELFGFRFGCDPVLGRLEVAGALLAPEDGDLFLNAFCDVYLCANAVDTHAGWIGRDADAAKTTKTVCVFYEEKWER